jgi:sigma-B regulation protein RsbU (phosphoserine phosphatase)
MSVQGYENTPDAERRLIELADLLEVSQSLNESLELDTILNRLLLASMGRFAVGRGLFLLGCPPSDAPGAATGTVTPGAASALGPARERFRVIISKGLADTPAGMEIELDRVPEVPVDLSTDPEGFEFFLERRLGLVIPLRRAGACVGLLVLGRKLTGAPFEPPEVGFLDSLASVATPAIENSRVYEELQQVNTRLDRKIQELNTLFEIGRKLVAVLDGEEVLRLFSYALMGQLLLTRHLIVLRRSNGEQIVRGRGVKLDDSHTWVDEDFWVLLSSLDGPLRIDPATGGALVAQGLAAIVPIRKDQVTHGFLGMGTRPSGQPFTDDELAFAGALANQAIISLENAWLFQETLEKRRMEEELALASAIQRNLFPKHLPEIPGYEIAARSTPTRHVGGDYYDMIDLGDGRTLIAIADVSGKGTPASLLMSNLQAALRALADSRIDLAANAAKINELIYSNTDFNKYATFFYGVLDATTHRFKYTNAGHNPPFLMRPDGTLEALHVGGLPVGLMPGVSYEQSEVVIHAEDVLVLYTDGVSEAVDAADEEFGEARIEQLCRECAGGTADALLDRIATEVSQFSEGLPQADDITLVVLKRLAAGGSSAL